MQCSSKSGEFGSFYGMATRQKTNDAIDRYGLFLKKTTGSSASRNWNQRTETGKGAAAGRTAAGEVTEAVAITSPLVSWQQCAR
eukprot:m.205631 g.205631  ORF g.205631 m.205631 type:complete len:84 (+) comp39661_c0_seq17:398-649(+)